MSANSIQAMAAISLLEINRGKFPGLLTLSRRFMSLRYPNFQMLFTLIQTFVTDRSGGRLSLRYVIVTLRYLNFQMLSTLIQTFVTDRSGGRLSLRYVIVTLRYLNFQMLSTLIQTFVTDRSPGRVVHEHHAPVHLPRRVGSAHSYGVGGDQRLEAGGWKSHHPFYLPPQQSRSHSSIRLLCHQSRHAEGCRRCLH